VPGYLLTRGFSYAGPDDVDAIHRAARLNAMETIVYFSLSAGLYPELPALSVLSTAPHVNGLWIEYEAAAPLSSGIDTHAFTDQIVANHPGEAFDSFLHDQFPGCTTEDVTVDGLHHLPVLVEGGIPNCSGPIETTTASLTLESVNLPQGRPYPAYERWFSDCLLDILMVFNRIVEVGPAPDDVAFVDRTGASWKLQSWTLPIGALEMTGSEAPANGVTAETFEGSCRRIGETDCVDVRVTLIQRDIDHELQIDPTTPSSLYIDELFREADIMYWNGHGFHGLAHEGRIINPDRYQLMVLAQCSSAANYSHQFFSMKTNLDRDLDLIGFPDTTAGTQDSAAIVLEALLKPERVDLRGLSNLLNASRIPSGDLPFVLVGSIESPYESQ